MMTLTNSKRAVRAVLIHKEPQVADKDTAKRETLTVIEAAQVLGIGRSRMYRACQSQEIPARKLGKRWLIPRVALDRWFAEVTASPPALAGSSHLGAGQ
jgi:excisionase family DNA binding protein